MKILLVEDDPSVAGAVDTALTAEGYEVVVSDDGAAALPHALGEAWSVTILDILLPGLNGFRLCREIRKFDEQTPILMLTAKDGE